MSSHHLLIPRAQPQSVSESGTVSLVLDGKTWTAEYKTDGDWLTLQSEFGETRSLKGIFRADFAARTALRDLVRKMQAPR